jgi:hypothetical protein
VLFRSVAKTLHQKLGQAATPDAARKENKELRDALEQERGLATKLVSERDRATQQVEALQRMIEQERSARVKAVAERDEYKSRFRALTSEAPSRTPADSGETTQSYQITTTETEMPRVNLTESPTVPVQPIRKKDT